MKHLDGALRQEQMQDRVAARLEPQPARTVADIPDAELLGRVVRSEMWQELVACVERKVAAERERCAMKLQVTRAEVQLAAGELSTEEWRMCAAVLRWMQSRIHGSNVRAKPPEGSA